MIEPLHLSVARLTEGVREIPGAANEALILRWAQDIGAPAYVNDEVAWCAVWMNRICLANQWPLSGRGYELLRAKSFADWGVGLSGPALGAIMVFHRPEGFHVGFYTGERPDAFWVFGGNTKNAVASTWIEKERLYAIRWPVGVALPVLAPYLVAANGQPLSTNEA